MKVRIAEQPTTHTKQDTVLVYSSGEHWYFLEDLL